MTNERDDRAIGSEDEQWIPAGVPLDNTLDAEMDLRTAECERDGHVWIDSKRQICTRCMRVWFERP